MNFDGNFLKVYFIVGSLALIYFIFFRGGFTRKQRALPLSSKQFMLSTQRDAADPNSVIIDIRSANDYRLGCIPSATNVDISSSRMKALMDSLPRDKHYHIYCQNGSKAASYALYLINSGFRNIHYLENGFDEWLRLGYPIDTNKPNDEFIEKPLF